MGSPRPSANALASLGPFSMTELNSSPRSTPEPRAWESWRITAEDSAAAAPESCSDRAVTCVVVAICS
jgi:hypothetical protein